MAYLKPEFNTAVAEAFFNNVALRNSRYYYFIGRVLDWANEATPPVEVTSNFYSKTVQRDIIFVKEIRPTDIAMILPNNLWGSGTVYTKYDDRHSSELVGIDIVSSGSNYTTGATATVVNPDAVTNANVSLQVNVSGKIVGATILEGGSDYTDNTYITVTDSTGSGANLQPVFAFADDINGFKTLHTSQFFVVTTDYNVYKCIDNNNAGESTIMPTGTGTSLIETEDGYIWKYMYTIPAALINRFYNDSFIPVTTAVSSQFYSNGEIRTVTIDNSGSGYTNANTSISIIGDGNGANLRPAINSSGNLVGVTILNGGRNYTYAYANVETTDLNGGNAVITVNLDEGGVDTKQGIVELLAVDGAIHSVEVVSGGSGYTVAPTVSITGDGSGANVSALINTGTGRVTGFTVNDAGSGYTFANVIITANDSGIAASGRAILPPYGGHGKNAVRELYSNMVCLYTSMLRDTNQGFTVNNNYRQIGILKDLRTYDNNEYFRGITGSACWVINGVFSAGSIALDSVLTQAADNSRFVVVAVGTNTLLATALDNLPPIVGSQISAGAVNFTITSVTKPDIDKYSGEVLYLNNKLAFAPSTEQSVTIKTYLSF